MPDITKLPKWAQKHIAGLERDLDRTQLELEELQSGSLINPDRQKFYVERFQGDPFWLPQYRTLNYKNDPTREGWPELSISESRVGLGGVEVRSGAMRGRLVVIPRVTNSVTITVIED